MTNEFEARLYRVEEVLEQSDIELAKRVGKDLALAHYLQENLQSAIAALKVLEIPYSLKSFENARLFGRLTPIRSNVLLDVGHNPLAARSIAKALHGQKVVLIGQRVEEKELLQKTLNDLKIQYDRCQAVQS